MTYIARLSTLLLLLAAFPVLAQEVDATIKARVRLSAIDLELSGDHQNLGILKTDHAPENMHFEVIHVHFLATWPAEGSRKSVTYRPKLKQGDKEVKMVAARDIFGMNRQTSSAYVSMRPYDNQTMTAQEDSYFIYLVADDATDLVLHLDDERQLKLPDFTTKPLPPSPVKATVAIVETETTDVLSREAIVQHQPKIVAVNEWKLRRGHFLLVDASVDLSADMPAHLNSVTLNPKHFGLKLADGTIIPAVGAVTPWDLADEGYSYNIGRNNDGTWPNSTLKLVFVVHGKADGASLVFLPAL